MTISLPHCAWCGPKQPARWIVTTRFDLVDDSLEPMVEFLCTRSEKAHERHYDGDGVSIEAVPIDEATRPEVERILRER